MNDPTTLTIVRTFDAPRERVWRAWTDPEMMKRWWGPKDFTAPSVSIDLREGGTYLTCMRGAPAPGAPVQDFWSGGMYTLIVPMEKIVATDHFTDAKGNRISPSEVGMPGEWPDEMLVSVAFEDEGDKTKLTLIHTGHPPEIVGPARQGWDQQFDKLEALLAD